jgi:hypothetical protein
LAEVGKCGGLLFGMPFILISCCNCLITTGKPDQNIYLHRAEREKKKGTAAARHKPIPPSTMLGGITSGMMKILAWQVCFFLYSRVYQRIILRLK